MRKLTNITVGADPELFLFDTELGVFFPAIGLIGGTKKRPKPMGMGCFLQEDNVLAEFNIAPARKKGDFTSYIKYALGKIRSIVPDKYELRILPSAHFILKYLNTDKAMAFGCDPDINIYSMSVNKSPCSTTTLRTASGHIHVGYSKPDLKTSIEIIKWLEVLITIPSNFLSDEYERRTLYGKSGSARFKRYGLEYRSPSNFWITNKLRMEWVWEQVQEAIEKINKGKLVSMDDYDQIINAINNCDHTDSMEIMQKYNVEINKVA